VGLLWNRDPRRLLPVFEWLREHTDLCIGDNQPYSGREVDYTMETHAGTAGLPHLEFEIRQDLLMDEAGCASWALLIGGVLLAALAGRSLHAVAHC
jgi:predicted N-formylglutamate amidohydrolase